MQDAVDFSWLRRCRAWVAVPIADEAMTDAWFCGDGKGSAGVPGEENCVEITRKLFSLFGSSPSILLVVGDVLSVVCLGLPAGACGWWR